LLPKSIALKRIRSMNQSIHPVSHAMSHAMTHAVAHPATQLPIVLLIHAVADTAIDGLVKATIDNQQYIWDSSWADPMQMFKPYDGDDFEKLMTGWNHKQINARPMMNAESEDKK
jgi:hypothetical protein